MKKKVCKGQKMSALGFICINDLTLCELGCSTIVTREAINFHDVAIVILLSNDQYNT